MPQVFRVSIPLLDQRCRPLEEHLAEFFPAQAEVLAAFSHPRRDLLVEYVRQTALLSFQFSPVDPGGQEPYAAVDVEAHTTRADHAAPSRVECRDSTYGEAVPPVDVRHRQRRLDYPGQRRDVLKLLQGGVVLGREILQDFLRGVECRVYLHLPLAGDRKSVV